MCWLYVQDAQPSRSYCNQGVSLACCRGRWFERFNEIGSHYERDKQTSAEPPLDCLRELETTELHIVRIYALSSMYMETQLQTEISQQIQPDLHHMCVSSMKAVWDSGPGCVKHRLLTGGLSSSWIHDLESTGSVRSNGNVHPAVSPSKVCWSTTRRLWTSTSSPKEDSWGEVLLGKSLLELTLLERAWKRTDLLDGRGKTTKDKWSLINVFLGWTITLSSVSVWAQQHRLKCCNLQGSRLGKYFYGNWSHYTWQTQALLHLHKVVFRSHKYNTTKGHTGPFEEALEPCLVDTAFAATANLSERALISSLSEHILQCWWYYSVLAAEISLSLFLSNKSAKGGLWGT